MSVFLQYCFDLLVVLQRGLFSLPDEVVEVVALYYLGRPLLQQALKQWRGTGSSIRAKLVRPLPQVDQHGFQYAYSSSVLHEVWGGSTASTMQWNELPYS